MSMGQRIREKVIVGKLNDIVENLLNWAKKSSLWPAHFVNGCCSPELMQVAGPRYDMERFGILPMASLRQSDVVLLTGVISRKMAKRIKIIYDQMPNPKYTVALGACAISKGIFYDSYSTVAADEIFPVDLYIPGCPPRPEAWLEALLKLRDEIHRGEKSG